MSRDDASSPSVEQLTARLNDTARDYPSDRCVHQLVEEAAERWPGELALIYRDQHVTFEQLEARANRLAHLLRDSGAGPEAPVAICLDRSPELVISVLAVLKAGAAYVPLDRSYPLERLRFMLQSSGVSVLLTDDALAAVLPTDQVASLLRLDRDAARVLGQPEQRLQPVASPGDLAYVLFTSGSTGRPKGVAMPHRPLVNLISWQRARSCSQVGNRTLQFAPISFDVSFQEIFATWAVGATLVLIDDDQRLDAMRLLRFIEQQRIDRVFLPFVALQHLAEVADEQGARPDTLREVVTAGEQLKVTRHLVNLFSQLSHCTLDNQYGPTECHVVTAHRLTGPPASWPELPPIGRPIANTRIYLLDEQQRPVALGQEGELYIGGLAVARGYLNQPEQTAARFVPDPFGDGPEARMYRSGDLARYGADSTIEFLGRIDAQVKVRGYRVELGEIEVALGAHGAVGQAAVIAREDVPGDKRLVAYVVPSTATPPRVGALRRHLAERLPDYMLPSAFVSLDELPRTPSGKVDRRSLPAPPSERPELDQAYAAPRGELEQRLARVWQRMLGVDRVGVNDNFFELGGNSLLGLQAVAQLHGEGIDLPIVQLYERPTIRALAQQLGGSTAGSPYERARSRRSADRPPTEQAIAIIGMVGRFPGAPDVQTLWQNLCEGREGITFFDEGELHPAIDPRLRRDPSYVPARGVIADADCFDAAFFAVNPRLAEVTDPQQRVFLELAWQALEVAGHQPRAFDGLIGVYAGVGNNSYYPTHVLADPRAVERVGAFQLMVSNEKDYVATRVAHALDLGGPALSIHTACSTSLAAICEAVFALRAGRCDMALAGGVSITAPTNSGYLYQEGAMLSPDGHCRPFDAEAAGTTFSDGGGVVVLRRLTDALTAGDPVIAVIEGAALNNDGANKASFTAPSVEGQALVVALAQADAEIEPTSISYLEAHGTATPLGDPIEIEGLTQAFAGSSDRGPFCAIGSIKGNLGHLTAAAGVAGLIKSALALQQKTIPPSINFSAPNPKIPFEQTPFFVNSTLRSWDDAPLPRRAGVSSFGVGGTNAHVILREPPEMEAGGPSRPAQLLLLSARTDEALERATANLGQALEQRPELDEVIADVAYTLQTGRRAFARRRALVCRDREEAVRLLRSEHPTRMILTKSVAAENRPVVFVFPGQGAQYVGMGASLYRDEPLFRQQVDRCAEQLQPQLEQDLRQLLYPAESSDEAAQAVLLRTAITQPALFTIEYALAQLWMSWGLRPEAMIGHSVGEFVAAALAGVFSLDDALQLVARRGKMMQQLPAGAMLSVRLPGEDLASRLPAGCSVAAHNGPRSSVASGPKEAISALQQQLAADKVACRPLHTSHAFHSAMMDPVVDPFSELVAGIALSAPSVPFVSTATGRWISDAEATDPRYWAMHLRQTVRFAEGIGTLWEQPERILLEVGPRRSSTTLALQQAASSRAASDAIRPLAIASLADSCADEGEWLALLGAVGELWSAGVELDWQRFYRNERRRRVPLPPYPFERERHWIEPPESSMMASPSAETTSGQTNAPDRVSEDRMPDPTNPAVDVPLQTRRERLIAKLKTLFEETAGIELEGADEQTTFFELGLDSLFLTQIALNVQRELSVKVTFRQLLEQFPTLGALADHLDAELPADALAADIPAAEPSPRATEISRVPAGSGAEPGSLAERVIGEQLQLMRQQLQLLRGASDGATSERVGQLLAAAGAVSVATPGPAATTSEANQQRDGHGDREARRGFGAMARIETGGAQAFNPRQQRCFDTFVERYTRRTAASKAYAERHRPHLADPRVVSGFRPAIKEIIYPIVVDRSKGSRLWDIDGNEYIDLLNGFGSNFFGYQPEFIAEALHAQIGRGIEIGPQNPLAGDVAQLICELTGLERAAFCNTGSEAVLGALRIARTVTGRDRIALFSGAYHGIFDEVIVRGTKKLRALPAAPGITSQAVDNVLVLEYGEPSALDQLRSQGHDLAAVLVEPVQSRRPDLQPGAFLAQVRAITRDCGAAMIMDEVITGFRIHPGGARAHFDVDADLATYGKIIGGGMPIGVIAGKADWMDALDGGSWRFGDASVPEAGVTYFAGTFVRHPLALAAAKAVLELLRREGPALQQAINARADRFARVVNEHCKAVGAPVKLLNFGSLCKLKVEPEAPFGELLFPWLRDKGIHAWDARPIFLTRAHSDEDVDHCVEVFKACIAELQEGELLPSTAVARQTPHVVAESVSPTSVTLTEPQREVWASAQMGDEANCAYNESISLRLRGPLEAEKLQRAAQLLVQRHQSLHARVSGDGSALRLDPELLIEVPVVDLSGMAEQDRVARRAQQLRQQVEQPFDLEQGPLVRVQLLVLGPQEHEVVFTAHHVICDGWSLNIVLRDLCKLYEHVRNGHDASQLPPAERFCDYAHEEAQFGASEAFVEAERFWLRQFEGEIPLLDLPTDRVRPTFRSYAAAREDRVIDADLVASLKKVGARQGASFVTTLLAAFQTLLYRLSGQRDLVVGLPAAGQAATGRLELVGHCVNLLPIRSRLDGGQPFDAYLGRLRTAMLHAMEQLRYTFGRLLQQLPLQRDPSRVPLVPVMFNIDTGIDSGVGIDGLEVELASNPRCFETFEIFLNALESEGRLVLEWTYNTDLFSPDTMRHWIDAFEALLRQIVTDASRPIDSLPLLSARERERMLVQCNDTATDEPRDRALHQLFELQVDSRSKQVAVVAGKEHLSYVELEQQANQLAHRLRELKVGPGTLVGLCLERTVQMPLALLGVLKTGAAYVPLDPDYPAERIAFILQDADCRVVLTQASLASQMPGSAHQLLIGEGGEDLSSWPSTRVSVQVEPDELAYVIYTSGSTGKPKGVQVPHGALVNFITAMAAEPGFSAEDVLLAITTLCFDISVLELFLPLSVGGKLVIADRETTTDAGRLAEMIEQQQVTVLQATPATWQMLVDSGWAGSSTLKGLCGGEALAPDLAAALRRRIPAFWNMYGPTETTVWSTCWRVDHDARPVPIGKPIANTQTYVLDDRLEPTPVGVPGELFIGGDGVTAGYKGRPELTAERFVADPFHAQPGRRLYRSGDLVRWRADGLLEFFGRRDFQVKVRGFRIELGEIEAMLAEHPSVGERVVIVREDRPGDKRIVAYFVPQAGGEVTTTELRKHLRQRLPEYMIPQHFVELDRLPRTPNGKIDRKALPALVRTGAEDGPTYVAPRTEAEILARLWAEALGVDRVSVQHNFFELGGHSLLSIKVLAQLAELTGQRLSPRLMLLNTLEQIAPELQPVLQEREHATTEAEEPSPTAPAEALGRGLLRKLRGKLRS